MKILYVTTVSVTMGFFPAHIRMLQEEGHTVELACNLEEPLPRNAAELGCTTHHIPFSRSPLSKDNIRAYRELKKLLEENRYDIVHTHTPNASVVVRLACRKLRKQGLRVFYTAHGFHFYDGAPLKNWLLFYPVEWLCSHWTDMLITINHEDYDRASRLFRAKKTIYVPGVGLDIEKFAAERTEEAKRETRKEFGVPEEAILLASVGELNANKNHSTIVRAIAMLNDKKVHYCIAGEGPLRRELESLSVELGIQEQVHLLGFQEDIPRLYGAADICVFPSVREGLGMAALEGMASGLPVIASDNRGTRDYLADEVNGVVCKLGNVNEFVKAIQYLISEPIRGIEMGRRNKEIVFKFSTEHILHELRTIYGIANEGKQ